MTEDFVPWSGGAVSTAGFDQLPALKCGQRSLDTAFGQTGPLGDAAQTVGNAPPAALLCPTIKKKIDQERGRMLVVTNQIRHEDIDHIIIDRNRTSKPRHRAQNSAIFLIGQRFLG
jgi:hypothetical protein